MGSVRHSGLGCEMGNQVITAGIDVGQAKAAIAIFDGELLVDLEEIISNAALNRHYQLKVLGERVTSVLNDNMVERVFIEQNLVGNNIKYSINLAQAVGAIASHALGEVDFVNVSSWKKAIVGKGNAKKDDVRLYVDGCYPEYTALCEGSQDKYDAICIGLYGVRLLDLAGSLAELR